MKIWTSTKSSKEMSRSVRKNENARSLNQIVEMEERTCELRAKEQKEFQ